MGNGVSTPVAPSLAATQRASFAGATALASYLLWRSMISPNPTNLETAKDSRTLADLNRRHLAISVLRKLIVGSAALNAITGLTGAPFTEALGLPLAKHVGQIDTAFVTWNATSAAVLATFVSSAGLRLYAMKELGKNFTFDLHDPDRLITDGLYNYVQHPSYPTAVISWAAGTAWFFRANGALGAYLPPPVWNVAVKWQASFHVLFGVYLVHSLRRRVLEEEAMLHDKFGEEWMDYNRKTARFVPFLF